MRSFWFFWLIALASNIAANAQTVAVAWAIGDTKLSAVTLMVFQFSSLSGIYVGMRVGARLIEILGCRRTIIVSSIFESVACLVVGLLSYSSRNHFDSWQGYEVATAWILVAIGIGIGGPPWIALVATWPGNEGESKQLYLNNVQSYGGKLIGPLVASIVMFNLHAPILIISFFNSLTFIAICAYLVFCKLIDGEEIKSSLRIPVAASFINRTFLFSSTEICLILVATISESIRTLLPRLLRSFDHSEFFFSAIYSLTAASAALLSFIVSYLKAQAKFLTIISMIGLSLGLLFWIIAPFTYAGLWIIGSIFIGGFSAIAIASVTKIAMDEVDSENRQIGAIEATRLRTLFGPAGAFILATGLPFLGIWSIALVTGLVGIVTLFIASKK